MRSGKSMRMFFRESGQQFYDSKFDIAKLSHIENPAVKVFCPQNYWRLKQRDWDLCRDR